MSPRVNSKAVAAAVLYEDDDPRESIFLFLLTIVIVIGIVCIVIDASTRGGYEGIPWILSLHVSIDSHSSPCPRPNKQVLDSRRLLQSPLSLFQYWVNFSCQIRK